MKRVLSFIAVFAALILVFTAVASAADGTSSRSVGNTAAEERIFHAEDRLQTSEVIADVPDTIEVTLKYPTGFSGNGGTILSNYDSADKANTICLGVDTKGAPVLTVRYDSDNSHRHIFTFSKVNLYTGEWIDLAIVRDGGSIHCYVDGVLVQTLSYTAPEITMIRGLYLGGDTRRTSGSHNYEYFKGSMKTLVLYSDARTAEEVVADMSAINVEDENLVAYYELENSQLADIIPDISKNGNAIIRNTITGGLELTETDNKSKNRYLAKTVTENYKTFEAMIKVDPDEYGVLYGNNNGAPSPNSVNLEINKNGNIVYRAYDTTHTSSNACHNTVTFNNPSVTTGEWVHIAVVIDEENMEFRCYINGTLVDTVTMERLLTVNPPRAMYLGRDYRTGSGLKQYNGEIIYLVTYSDVRSESEIRYDVMNGAEYCDELISYYDMKFADGSATIPDRSGNGADIVNSAKPVDPLAVEGGGISIDTNTLKYTETCTTYSIPATIEFTMKVDAEKVAAAQRTILSNYRAASTETYSYVLRLMSGIPRMYLYYNNAGGVLEYRFSNAKNSWFCTGDWVNVAITMDTDAKEFKCYINGVQKDTVSFYDDAAGKLSDAEIDAIDFNYKFNYPLILGATYGKASAARPFTEGEIQSMVLYSDVRTATEIAGDYYFPGTSDMLAYWDASYVGAYKDIPDRSNNLNDMKVTDSATTKVDTKTYDNETNAMTFARDKYYEAASTLETTPLTIEAMVKYPRHGSGKGSASKKGSSVENVIFGNFYGKTTANALNFGISNTNNPMIYAIDRLGTVYTFIFDEVTVNTEYWEHIAITFDAAAGFAYCYQNGVLVQKIYYNGELNGIDWSGNEFAHVLGGDWQSERREYFNRKLGYLALYSDIRTAEEIYSDVANGISADDAGLMCYYDCTGGDNGGVISDSKNGKYDLTLFNPWVEIDERDPDSYDYSIAIVGDTQNLTYSYNSALTALYDWLVANADSKKLGFVVGVGDINEKDSDKEWLISSAEIEKLRDAGIPQSLVCGGTHDSIPQFNKYLPYTEYVEAYDGKVVYGFFDDGSGVYSLSNSYQLITIGETPYMFLSLEWAPKTAHVAWANEVIAAHPEYNVIISTHAYLADDGTRFNTWHHATPDGTGKKEAHNGEELWNELVRKHANIVMVVGGHDTSDFVLLTEDYGDHGNRVVQLMINPQHTDIIQKGTGMVAMLYFSEGGRTVNLEYYSTAREMHYREENQFTFEMPLVSADSADIGQASVSLGNSINVNYYVHLTGKYTDAVMKFTVLGDTVTVQGERVGETEKYKFTYKGIAPHLMGEIITAELVYNGEVIDTSDTFSVERYARSILKMNKYDLKYGADKVNTLHALVVEMLAYGAEAQKYVGHKTDALVNAGVESTVTFDPEAVTSVKTATAPVGDSGAKFTGITVRFDYVNRIRFDFTPGTAALSEITVRIGDKVYTEEDFVSLENGKFAVYTEAIYATSFDKAYTATLTVGGEEVHSATYSVNSYVKAMHTNAAIGALGRAIYSYGEAAKKFVTVFNA